MRVDLESLEAAVGYHFRDRKILLRALTHSSHVHEQPNSEPAAENGTPEGDNEQLEFFGDAVLGFLISEALYRKFPAFSEGSLSKLKAHLVSAAHLLEVAQRIEIGKYLFLGRGEEMSGGRLKKTLQVDGLEALIAGLCLDGGVEVARDFVTRYVLAELEEDTASSTSHGRVVDFKSALQELAQQRKLPPPRYSIVKERGPEHSKTFTIEVRVGRDLIGRAEGCSKKIAAQNAARAVLAILAEAPTA